MPAGTGTATPGVAGATTGAGVPASGGAATGAVAAGSDGAATAEPTDSVTASNPFAGTSWPPLDGLALAGLVVLILFRMPGRGSDAV
jgi:hypothetical protein